MRGSRMKKVILNILHLLLNVVLAASLFVSCWCFLTPYFRVNRNTQGDAFRNLPADTVQVLAVGSSHMQYAFNPGVYYAMTGAYSYVFASVCQPFDASYWIIKEAFEHQSPKLVYIDIYTLLPQSSNCYANEVYYIAGDMLSDANRDEMLKGAVKLDETTRLMYRFDLYMNHDRWRDMDLLDLKSIEKNAQPSKDINGELGYVRMEPTNLIYTPLAILDVTENVELSSREKKEIDDIITLCRSNGAVPVFTCAPFLMDQDSTNKKAAVWKYLDQKGISFIDEIADSENHWFLDMNGDTAHNNSWGADIVTRDYAKFALDNNIVKASAYNAVYDGLVYQMNRTNAWSLMNETNINVYTLLDDAKYFPCTVLLRFGANRRHGLPEDEAAALNAIGFTKDFVNDYRTGYYAVVQNGQLVRESDEPFDMELNGHSLSFSEDAILLDGAAVDSNGEMQLVFGGDDLSWTNAIGIDYVSRWFWKNGCDGWNCSYAD